MRGRSRSTACALARDDLVAAAAAAIADPLAETPQLNVLAPADMAAGPVPRNPRSCSAQAGVPVRLVTVEEEAAP